MSNFVRTLNISHGNNTICFCACQHVAVVYSILSATMPPPLQPTETADDGLPDFGGENAFGTAQNQEIPAPNGVPDKPRRGRPPGLLPTPRVFDLPPDEFFRYWWKLRADDRIKRADVRAFRLWPIIDVLLELPPEEQDRLRKLKAQHKSAGPPTNLGLDTTSEPFDPSNWEQEIYHRYGSGDYHFKLYDRERKSGDRPVCTCTVKGLRDWDRYFPDVRPSIVVTDDPANKSYMDKARARGIHFPGDATAPDSTETADMAEQKSSEILANTLSSVVDKLQAKTNEPAKDNGMVAVFGQMLQIMQAQSNAQMDAIIKRLDAQEKALPPAPPPDPMAAVKPLVDLARTIANPDGGDKKNDMVALLMKMNEQAETRRIEEAKLTDARQAREMEMLTKRLEATETLLKETMAKKAEPQPPAGAGELKKLIQSAVDIKTLFEGLSGGNPSAGEPWWLAPIENLVEKGFDTAKVVTGNMAAMKRPIPQVVVQGQPAIPQSPSQTRTQGQPQTQPQMTQEQEQMFVMDQVAAQIHPELLQALEAGQTGYEFAGRLIAAYGHLPQFRQLYNGLLIAGTPGVIGDSGFLRRSPQRWGELLRFGPKLQQFVSEFLDVQKAEAIAAAILQQQAGKPEPETPQKTQEPQRTQVPQDKPNGTPAGSATPGTKKGRRIITPDGPVDTQAPQ